MTLVKEEFFAALAVKGMPEIPKGFSVVLLAQLIPRTTLVEIDNFIRLFDRVTTRVTWQRVVTTSALKIAQLPRGEVCFFTSWDFYLSPEQGWQVIEGNDNGSGFVFAALINRLFLQLRLVTARGRLQWEEIVVGYFPTRPTVLNPQKLY
jgi:hypothetical protein